MYARRWLWKSSLFIWLISNNHLLCATDIIQILDISSTQGGGQKKISLGGRKAVTAPRIGSGKAYRKPAAWVQFRETADPKKLSSTEPQAQQHQCNPPVLSWCLSDPPRSQTNPLQLQMLAFLQLD